MMMVYVVFSPEAEMCEVFETFEAAHEFRNRNNFTRWLISQKDVRSK